MTGGRRSPASHMRALDSISASTRRSSRRQLGDAAALSLAVLAAVLFAGLIRPADAVWQQVAKYWDASCGGPPYEITYFNNTNITSCSSLPAPVNNCSISRNSTGAIVGGQKTLFCSATRPSNFSHNFPPEMQGNYIISTTFSTPFAFFVDVQTMCCDLPVTEHVVRMNSSCSPAVVPQGGYNWTYLDCSYEGEGLQKICRSSACEDSSCIIVNKYNPNSCQGGGGKFQRAFCLRADGGNVSNVGQWPEISPAQCNSTVYTQKPGHQPPWTDPKKSAAGAVSAGSLKTAAIAVAVALATILL